MKIELKPYQIYLVLSIAILGKILASGYIFTLDMIFPPYRDLADTLYSVEQFYPIWVSTQLPLYFLMGFLNNVISIWLIQKIILFLILFLSGVSAYRLCPFELKSAKYFAGFIYIINPFVYVRFLAGHWKILFAYAIVPFAIMAFINLLERQDRKSFISTLFWLTLTGIFNVQILILALIILGILFTLKVIQVRREAQAKNRLLKIAFFLSLSYIVLNAYWLIPTISAESTIINQMGDEDMYTYATKPSTLNAAFTTASMYGFWRGGYLYTKDILPIWYVFFVFLLFLAVHGFVSHHRDEKIGMYVKAFGVTAVIGLILGSGIYGPFSGVFEFLYNNVPFFRGFRDSQKFVALIVLGYAYLGSLGVARFEDEFRERDKRKKIFSMVLMALAIITPFIYSFTMFNGFSGQLSSVDYPKDWYEMNEFLNNDTQEFNVLFFPWHAYMDFKWLPNSQKRLLNPAASFFDKPIITGENAEISGVYTYSEGSVQRYIQFLLIQKDSMDNFGELVTPLNIKYVLLTKEVDYKKYSFLFNQSDLELVNETENFYVFRNKHEVAKIYEVDSITYIKDWGELLERSRNEDITERAYLIGDSPENTQENSSKKLLDYQKESPVKYILTGDTSKKYLVFTEPYSESWELDGKKPIGAYGVVNAYEISGANGREILFTRFYNIYLPSYIISILTFIILIVFYLDIHGKISRASRQKN